MPGYGAAAAMGVSGVNGLAQEWMGRTAGYRAWLRVHRIAVGAAVALLLTHAILMGTDLAPVRGLPDRIPGVSF